MTQTDAQRHARWLVQRQSRLRDKASKDLSSKQYELVRRDAEKLMETTRRMKEARLRKEATTLGQPKKPDVLSGNWWLQNWATANWSVPMTSDGQQIMQEAPVSEGMTYGLSGYFQDEHFDIADIAFDESPIEAVVRAVLGLEEGEEIRSWMTEKDGVVQIHRWGEKK